MRLPSKNLFRVHSRLFAGCLFLAFFTISIFAQETLVFESGTDGNATYRIPAIIKLQSGKLLAFSESRKKGVGNFGDVNIVLRVVSVGRKTFWLTAHKILIQTWIGQRIQILF